MINTLNTISFTTIFKLSLIGGIASGTVSKIIRSYKTPYPNITEMIDVIEISELKKIIREEIKEILEKQK